METAPARIISRAHTVAKIGRLMKKSTKSTLPLYFSSTGARRLGVTSETIVLADRLNRRPVNKELGAGYDDFFPGLQAAIDGIVVPDGVPESYCTLLGNAPVLGLSCHVDKCLSSDACHCQHWNRWRRSGAPHDSRLDQLCIPEPVERATKRRLHQYPLERVVHLLRNEIDLCALDQLSAACDNLDGEAHTYVRGTFRGDVDIGFQFSVLILG